MAKDWFEAGDIRKNLTKIGLIPKYSEISLYLTALTFLLLALTNQEIMEIVGRYFSHDLEGIITLLILIFGMFCSLHFALSDEKTPKFAKSLMLIFVIFTNLGVSICACHYIIKNNKDIFIIFPIMNMVYAILLVLLLRINIINEESISDENARPHEIIIGSILLVVLFLFSQYVMKNYWAITFSICLTYSSTINGIVTKIFFKE